MISVSIELSISELTRKEMTSRIKHVGASHQSLLAKAWASVASATPCISFDVAELLLKEIYEQHSANPTAVTSILGEHFEYFIHKACLYTELKAAEKNVHEIAAKYMASKKPEADVKLEGAKEFADAFVMMLNSLKEMHKVREVDEALSKNKEKAEKPIKENKEAYDLSIHTRGYYNIIEASKKVNDPIGFIWKAIYEFKCLQASLPVYSSSFKLCTKEINDLKDYLQELNKKKAVPVV